MILLIKIFNGTHIYKSIEIKDYLYSFFPLPDLAIELVIKN